MAGEEGKKEDQFGFTPEGERLGYISLEEAWVLAIRHARDNSEFYGPRYSGTSLVWEIISQDEGEDYYDIKLSFRPAGRFRGEPGVEQFIIDKMGNIDIRQMLDEPTGMEETAGPPATPTQEAPPTSPQTTASTPTATPTPTPTPTPSGGDLRWRYQTGSSVRSSPAVADGVVYVGSWDNHVYALDASSGDLLWSYQTGSTVYSSPAVAGGVVYVGSVDHHVYAITIP